MLERIARLVNKRPKAVLWTGLVLIILSAVLGSGAPKVLLGGGFDVPNAPSTVAQELLDDNFGGQSNLAFVLQAKAGTVDDPAVSAQATDFVARLQKEADVTNVVSYWPSGAPAMRSEDSRSGLVLLHVAGDDTDSADRASELIDDFNKDTTAVAVDAGGALGVQNDINVQVADDLAKAEMIAIPLTLLLLLFVFRSVIAAALPLLIGVSAIFGTLAALFLIGSVTDVSIYSMNLTTAMGLGLAIDYALLIVSRFREELALDPDVDHAIERTMLTAGRTVMFSAATVAVALMALIVFPLFFLRSFAYAGAAVVLIALASALLLLPAALRLLGPRVDSWRIGPKRELSPSSPFWERNTRRVMRRPILSALPVLVIIGVMAVPFFHIAFGTPDDRVLGNQATSRTASDIIRNDFSANNVSAVSVVVKTTWPPPDLTNYFEQLSIIGNVARVESAAGTFVGGALQAAPTAASSQFVSDGVEYADVIMSGDAVGAPAEAVVHHVRDVPVPANADVSVGGLSASLVDVKHTIAERLPFALAIIAITTLVLLFLYTGSVVLPVKALLLNLITMTGVLGLVVWVFQDGHLSGLLDFNAAPINIPMPILLFCIAFGLSMDYEVFVLSRIKEARDAGMDDDEAVVHGLARTGRIITMAAALLAVTFVAFGTSHVSFLQLFGLGTALAILLDATLVRGILVPSFMKLLGDANWWAPKPLRKVYEKYGLRD